MENICNNYRNIVERAVLAGIITEDTKEFYLSAIDEEHDSDLSELENHLNKHEASHLNSFAKKNADCSMQLKSDSRENCSNTNTGKYELTNDICFEDNNSISGDTIENYSIFDFEHCKPKEGRVQESTSETSLSKPSSKTSSMIKKCASSSIIPQVMKKPRKNQIVDFNVPIYIDTKKKKVCMKPDNSQFVSSEERKSKIPNTHTCKYNGGNREVQSLGKWTLNLQSSKKSPKKERRSCASNKTSFNASEIFKQALRNFETKVNKHSIQEANTTKDNSDQKHSTHINSYDLNKMAHQFLSQEGDPDETECCCRHPVVNIKKSRNHNMQMNKESRHRMKIQKPVTHSNSCHRKMETVNVYKDVEKRLGNYKPCKNAYGCKTVHHLSNTNNSIETVSDDGTSLSSILVPSRLKRKEQDRQLNVNIFCQFYQTGETEELNNIQVEENLNASRDIPLDEPKSKRDGKDADETRNEKPKSSPNRRIQRLSNIFKNMRINKRHS